MKANARYKEHSRGQKDKKCPLRGIYTALVKPWVHWHRKHLQGRGEPLVRHTLSAGLYNSKKWIRNQVPTSNLWIEPSTQDWMDWAWEPKWTSKPALLFQVAFVTYTRMAFHLTKP